MDEIIIDRINQATSLDDIAKGLFKLLRSNTSVWENEDGTECFYSIRARVDEINGIRIEVRPRDHAPPHFHITSGNQSCSLQLSDCEILKGNFDNRGLKIIRLYFKYAKPKLIEIWNATRSTDSLVGKYSEPSQENITTR